MHLFSHVTPAVSYSSLVMTALEDIDYSTKVISKLHT